MQPTEPETTHAWPAPLDAKPAVPPPAVIPVSDASTKQQLDIVKAGQNRPPSGHPVVTSNDIEKGELTPPISLYNLWEHVQTPATALEDEGKGYEDWLKLPKLDIKDAPATTALHSVLQLGYVVAISIPCVLLSFIFSLLVRSAVEEWHADNISPLQKNPIIAGLIGEPFHHLSTKLVYATFVTLVLLCPYACCITKTLIHPLYLFGRQVVSQLWKPAVALCSVMAFTNLMAAVIMQTSGRHVPRIAWMGCIFLCLFAGLFVCSRKAARILDFPPLTLLYFRASFIANVLLYLYAVFFPFWFFGTESLAAKLLLAIGFHPVVEFSVAFLWQHTAVYLRCNDPATSIYPGFHYSCLFALYGAFLLVNFAETWHNILAFSLLRAWSIVCKIFAQEVTYATYRYFLRLPPAEITAILRTVRFKRYRNDVITSGAIIESVTIVVAGAVTYLFRFNKSADDMAPETSSFGDTALLVLGQVVIGIVCDGIADMGLAYRGLPWYNAWRTKERTALFKFTHLAVVSVGMFLFYFYPFLASHMVVD